MKRRTLIALSIVYVIALIFVGTPMHRYFHPEIALAEQRHQHKLAISEKRRRHEAQQRQAMHAANERRRIAFDKAHPEFVAQRQAEEARKQSLRDAAAAERRRHDNAAEAYSAEHSPSMKNCSKADSIENQAAAASGSQQIYDLAVHGLAVNEYCSDDTDKLINKGYLLSFKGTAEHDLASGDSKTDLNEANQVLVECQTTPGVYGTHAAASCETQEENNIHAQTNWDMGN